MSSGVIFPSSLPHPLPDYTDQYVETRSAFESETGYVRRRRRASVPPRKFELHWDLSLEQYKVFDDWFQNTLTAGSRPFDIQLLDDDFTLVWYTLHVTDVKYVAESTETMDWRISLQTQTIDEYFEHRAPSSSDLEAFAEGLGYAIGTLKDPGSILLGYTLGESTAIARFLPTLLGFSDGETSSTGRIIINLRGHAFGEMFMTAYFDDELRITDDLTIRETDDGLNREID